MPTAPPASFRPHGAHRRRYETVTEAYRCSGDWHKAFALWVSISLLRTWRSGERMSPCGVGSPGRHGGILPVVSRMLASVTGSLIIAAKPEGLLRQEKVTVPSESAGGRSTRGPPATAGCPDHGSWVVLLPPTQEQA